MYDPKIIDEHVLYWRKLKKYEYWLGTYIPEHMQKEAYDFLVHQCREEDIEWIVCSYKPYIWDNAIKVVQEIGYPKNRLAAKNIMHLFKDMDRDYSATAFYVIKEIYEHEPDFVIKVIEAAIKEADSLGDKKWLYGLGFVKESLITNKNCFEDKLYKTDEQEDLEQYSKDFQKYLYWLGDYIPEHMVDEARNFFLYQCKEKDIPNIISLTNGFTWDNAIKIIKKIGYPKNRLATQNVMYMFQDINWECADTGTSVIKEIYEHEPDIVIKAIEDTAKKANMPCDDPWLYGLSSIKEKLNISKNDFKDPETINILFKGFYWDSIDEIE